MAPGSKGGLGNSRFATATDQRPRVTLSVPPR